MNPIKKIPIPISCNLLIEEVIDVSKGNGSQNFTGYSTFHVFSNISLQEI